MGFSSKTRIEAEEAPVSQRVQTLKWHKPTLDERYGKNISLLGQPMAGKTFLALLLGYFNSQYKTSIKEAGYDRIIEVMNSGLLPEIEKIVVRLSHPFLPFTSCTAVNGLRHFGSEGF